MDIHGKIKTMQAYADGKVVQVRNVGGVAWRDLIVNPEWNWGVCEYRIKPGQEKIENINVQYIITTEGGRLSSGNWPDAIGALCRKVDEIIDRLNEIK